MFSALIWLSGGILGGAMVLAYRRSRDPLHPLMYLAPMFLYFHVLIPLSLQSGPQLLELFPDMESLEFAQGVVTLQLAVFCLGGLIPRPPAGAVLSRPLEVQVGAAAVLKMRLIALFLGLIGVVLYLYRLSTVGGFIRAYSRPKGGGAIAGLSGYITGGSLLTIPAIILLLISRRDRKLDAGTVLLLILFATPIFLQGILGGSRGNAFLALAAVGVGWYLTRARRPSLRALFIGLALVGTLMFVLKTHRRSFYLGSETAEFNPEALREEIRPTEINPSHVTPLTWGVIIATQANDHFFWGRRYAAQMFVRPIPRQLWPTKYEDLGLAWMVNQPGSAGMTPSQWRTAVGWAPPAGSAVGLIGDTFLELAWGGLAVCYLIGFLYAWLWKQAVLKSGLWTILYFEACVVSVYLPTQGLSTAWLYRFAYVAVPSLILWNAFIKERHTPAPPPLEPAETSPRFS